LPYVAVAVVHPKGDHPRSSKLVAMLWDTGCTQSFLWFRLFSDLLARGLVLWSRKFSNPRRVNGSCGGSSQILGWCVVALCFGDVTVPVMFLIVDNLGCDMMFSNSMMHIMSTVLDHGASTIQARHTRMAFETEPTGDQPPKLTLGLPIEGLAPESLRPRPLCKFYNSWSEAAKVSLSEFRPKLEEFTQPVPSGYHKELVCMMALCQL